MEDFQKFSKKALETPFWKISKSFMELFPCELGDPIVALAMPGLALLGPRPLAKLDLSDNR